MTSGGSPPAMATIDFWSMALVAVYRTRMRSCERLKSSATRCMARPSCPVHFSQYSRTIRPPARSLAPRGPKRAKPTPAAARAPTAARRVKVPRAALVLIVAILLAGRRRGPRAPAAPGALGGDLLALRADPVDGALPIAPGEAGELSGGGAGQALGRVERRGAVPEDLLHPAARHLPFLARLAVPDGDHLGGAVEGVGVVVD